MTPYHWPYSMGDGPMIPMQKYVEFENCIFYLFFLLSSDASWIAAGSRYRVSVQGMFGIRRKTKCKNAAALHSAFLFCFSRQVAYGGQVGGRHSYDACGIGENQSGEGEAHLSAALVCSFVAECFFLHSHNQWSWMHLRFFSVVLKWGKKERGALLYINLVWRRHIFLLSCYFVCLKRIYGARCSRNSQKVEQPNCISSNLMNESIMMEVLGNRYTIEQGWWYEN